MNLTSLTYTSLARLDLEAPTSRPSTAAALELNALDGITGLLVFNGTHFLQIIEGAQKHRGSGRAAAARPAAQRLRNA